MHRLWSLNDLCRATKGQFVGEAPKGYVGGISIDSRSILPGEAFFAIKGKRCDGHDYVVDVVQKKASLIVIDKQKSASIGRLFVPVLLVDDVLAALHKLAVVARLRSKARIIAITGSVGKTTTKEMLKFALSSYGKTHVCADSYNNHIGVPLTLARMPDDADFGIFELGMNHAGELRSLTQLVRPHIAVITNIFPVHLGNFSGIDAIASAKAEIFEGLEKNGSVVLNRDNGYFEFLQDRSRAMGIKKVYSFGESCISDFQLLKVKESSEKSWMTARIQDKTIKVRILAPGKHMVHNILLTLGIVSFFSADIAKAIKNLSEFQPKEGRGKRYKLALESGYFTLIDESYNANPASMQAAIEVLAKIAPHEKGRRIAVLGDMCEMGERSDFFHANLSQTLLSHKITHVWLSGIHMRMLKEALSENIDIKYCKNVDDLLALIRSSLVVGDVVVVKSSQASNFQHIVKSLLQEFKILP
ncbi:UDP-N-acetylmuramoyl-tripeptide--D-alanyl-D-alanine ligase [Candidatus Liberibacter sp.]|uniref:UDP-N-acetylmuramoyl-tripeptide--D-alanyl-D- alanine ligase n=1 Tax=Candidatus Liberibacter sp. TaxID=34022 RepID=UPI0015F72632|nr:UDP-N-acetylmuramoyl-tripeptide--D-alanyl-D-alanine ligase [Candidatus Liberibacter sp.]MBA5724058.1 UDP-N-acetylmuramoyl-tripeptide--D-alanyl-D-alanine ligase [Candidatus Liberibacter sp.]